MGGQGRPEPSVLAILFNKEPINQKKSCQEEGDDTFHELAVFLVCMVGVLLCLNHGLVRLWDNPN